VNKYHIELTKEEAALLFQIDTRTSHASHEEGHAAYNANRKPILALVRSLSERRALPQERLSYWNDPAYNPGRIKASRKGVFERNGCKGEDIYIHPHFMRHLRYFLFGADLPENLILEFSQSVGDPSWVTSSDILPIGKRARDLARRYGLDMSGAAEEFFKLCLDMGLGVDTAGRVKRSVQQAR
jgi:hypothetical protein